VGSREIAPLLARVTRRAPLDASRYPFTVPAVRALDRLDFTAAVTFFVGENGSGKSTLLEALAAAAELPAIGSASVGEDATLAPARVLANDLTLGWHRRTHRGFFLRAEDFFGFTRFLSATRAEFEARLEQLDTDYVDRSSHALSLAKGPVRTSLREMERRYGIDLDTNSHGESFLRVFQHRFVPDGLYLLDEPEAPLSPQSQLALLAMIGDMVKQGGQFVIATHSPILLAFPGAQIVSFDGGEVVEARYDELEHVRVTRDFLNAPERYLRQLLDDDA
jgi:predicted ATPase